MHALVYADSGVNKLSLNQTLKLLHCSGYKTTLVKAQEVAEGSLFQKATLFVMPGGADLFYVKKLNGAGNEQLSHFVKNGGTYLGICAGAYYGGARVEFATGEKMEVTGQRELGFFPGTVKGPAFPGFVYDSHIGAHPATLSGPFFNQKCAIYCNGGGYFVDAEKMTSVQVLSRFDELPNHPAAIVACACGKGRALLSSVHFEYDPHFLNHPELQEVLPHLMKYVQERETLVNKLMRFIHDPSTDS